ncbi:MAG: aconitate hydratase AcnA, partial [Gemmatimonadetes bacterium]|nr:aconitate hydratase AcnA [Gemmatimonadota bacterium]
MSSSHNSYGTERELSAGGGKYRYHSLPALMEQGFPEIGKLPISRRILLENLLQYEDGRIVTKDDIAKLAKGTVGEEIAFRPARVLLQDFTGVPAVADLAAMRNAMVRLGGDPNKINPLQPADLVIDHSVQVDKFGTADAFRQNGLMEFDRNQERYIFLRWGQQAFRNFRVVPPETGIVHQVNLEYLGRVVFTREVDGVARAYPDTLVGTDSHTTMINALGIVGWGVGGIEAEAAMLGRPISMLIPEVVGFRLTGKLPAGSTATDLVLTVTQMLRKHGVVGKFVEFYGPALSNLTLPDRATIANMAPEYGATIGFFPVDEKTLDYLRLTGREPEQIALVEAYCKEQGIFVSEGYEEPVFSSSLELDLGTVHPSLAGPSRPQDRVDLPKVGDNFRGSLSHFLRVDEQKAAAALTRTGAVKQNGDSYDLKQGAVVIAAITSCTNTSNPSVLIAAGLLARNAVAKGLHSKPWVKT